MPPSLEEGISNTGIQGLVLQRMSTQLCLQEDEICPINQAETSRHASGHNESNWLLAEFSLDEATASITKVSELITIAIKLHHLRTIVICLNTTNSAKAHPIKHRMRHLKDVEEWYSGGTIAKNTRHAGGGIEKQTRVITIHKELDPITAAMATKENHPSPATISKGLDTRPGIIDDYDWPRAHEQKQAAAEAYQARPAALVALTATISEGLDTRPGIIDDYDWPRAHGQKQAAAEAYQARPAALVALLEDSTTTERPVFDPNHPGPDINRAVGNQSQSAPFGTLLKDEVFGSFCRGIRPHEFLRLMGKPVNLHIDNEWMYDELYNRMTWRTPTTTIQWATQTILLSEQATIGPVKEPDNQSADTTRYPS
jgi:hypothetical protein